MRNRFLAALVLAGSLAVLVSGPATAAAASTVTMSTTLTGSEVPGGGDTDATGSATLVLDKAAKTICYSMDWSAVDGSVTATHIHVAPVGQTGPPFVHLFNNASYPGTGSASGCVAATASQISSLIKSPTRYYVNVHSTAYPNGAIRGQLGD